MWQGRKAVDPAPSNLLRLLGGSFTTTVDVTVEDDEGIAVHHLEMESPRGTIQVRERLGAVSAWLLS